MKSEFDLIEDVKNKFSRLASHTTVARVGIGDDCAVLPKDSKTDLVVTSDLLVEEIDFRLEWIEPKFLGHKALAVSLSDIAAMGAKPVWSLVSIGVPEKIWKTDFVENFFDGYYRLASKFNVELVGGDVSRTPEKIVIDSTVAGEAAKGKAVLRSTAKAGDLVYVTGSLGGAAGGLKLLENGFRYGSPEKIWRDKLILKQLQPFPQISDGEFLSEKNLATSMIDLSDGLSSDLSHLCRASKVGAKIFADRIPIEKKLSGLTKSFDEQLDFALNGGEDFELLFTVNPKKNFQIENQIEKRRFSCIGEITESRENIELIRDSASTTLRAAGFAHF